MTYFFYICMSLDYSDILFFYICMSLDYSDILFYICMSLDYSDILFFTSVCRWIIVTYFFLHLYVVGL